MAHCHISEHIESGMMFHFRVARRHQEDTMAMVTDPVCGMRIDSEDAAARAEHRGVTYYFCSQACHDTFVAAPGSHAG
jgi:Cu+-exporting ATPase